MLNTLVIKFFKLCFIFKNTVTWLQEKVILPMPLQFQYISSSPYHIYKVFPFLLFSGFGSIKDQVDWFDHGVMSLKEIWKAFLTYGTVPVSLWTSLPSLKTSSCSFPLPPVRSWLFRPCLHFAVMIYSADHESRSLVLYCPAFKLNCFFFSSLFCPTSISGISATPNLEELDV